MARNPEVPPRGVKKTRPFEALKETGEWQLAEERFVSAVQALERAKATSREYPDAVRSAGVECTRAEQALREMAAALPGYSSAKFNNQLHGITRRARKGELRVNAPSVAPPEAVLIPDSAPADSGVEIERERLRGEVEADLAVLERRVVGRLGEKELEDVRQARDEFLQKFEELTKISGRRSVLLGSRIRVVNAKIEDRHRELEGASAGAGVGVGAPGGEPDSTSVLIPKPDHRDGEGEYLLDLTQKLDVARDLYAKDPKVENKRAYDEALRSYNEATVTLFQEVNGEEGFVSSEKKKEFDATVLEQIFRANAISEQLKIEKIQNENRVKGLIGRASQGVVKGLRLYNAQYKKLPWYGKVGVALALAGPGLGVSIGAMAGGAMVAGSGVAWGLGVYGLGKLGFSTAAASVRFKDSKERKVEERDEKRIQFMAEQQASANADVLVRKLGEIRQRSLDEAGQRKQEAAYRTRLSIGQATLLTTFFAGSGYALVHSGLVGEIWGAITEKAEAMTPDAVDFARGIVEDVSNFKADVVSFGEKFFDRGASSPEVVFSDRILLDDFVEEASLDAVTPPPIAVPVTPVAEPSGLTTEPPVGEIPPSVEITNARPDYPVEVSPPAVLEVHSQEEIVSTPIPTEHVSERVPLGNGTARVVGNETRLQWGGSADHKGVILNPDGTPKEYVIDVSHMRGVSTDGYGHSYSPQKIIKNGDMVILFNTNDASEPVSVQVSPDDGKVHIPADSPMGKLFTMNADGDAEYQGGSFEAATKIGDEKYAVFATHLGEGTAEGVPMAETMQTTAHETSVVDVAPSSPFNGENIVDQFNHTGAVSTDTPIASVAQQEGNSFLTEHSPFEDTVMGNVESPLAFNDAEKIGAVGAGLAGVTASERRRRERRMNAGNRFIQTLWGDLGRRFLSSERAQYLSRIEAMSASDFFRGRSGSDRDLTRIVLGTSRWRGKFERTYLHVTAQKTLPDPKRTETVGHYMSRLVQEMEQAEKRSSRGRRVESAGLKTREAA